MIFIFVFFIVPFILLFASFNYVPVNRDLGPHEQYFIKKNSLLVDQVQFKDPSGKIEVYFYSQDPSISDQKITNSTTAQLPLDSEMYEAYSQFFVEGSKIKASWNYSAAIDVYIFKEKDFNNWVSGSDDAKYVAYKRGESGDIKITVVDRDVYVVVFYNLGDTRALGTVNIYFESLLFDMKQNVIDKKTGSFTKDFGIGDKILMVLYNPDDKDTATISVQYSWRTEFYYGIFGLLIGLIILKKLTSKSKTKDKPLLQTSQQPGASMPVGLPPQKGTSQPPTAHQGFESPVYNTSSRGDTKHCPKCGALVLAKDNFCGECGAPLK